LTRGGSWRHTAWTGSTPLPKTKQEEVPGMGHEEHPDDGPFSWDDASPDWARWSRWVLKLIRLSRHKEECISSWPMAAALWPPGGSGQYRGNEGIEWEKRSRTSNCARKQAAGPQLRPSAAWRLWQVSELHRGGYRHGLGAADDPGMASRPSLRKNRSTNCQRRSGADSRPLVSPMVSSP